MYANAELLVRSVIDQVEPCSAGWLWPNFMDDLPVAHVKLRGGTQGAFDRRDRVEVDVYARPLSSEDQDRPTALELAERFYAKLVDSPHYTPAGVIDQVVIESAPSANTFTPDVDLASFSIYVVHRPVD